MNVQKVNFICTNKVKDDFKEIISTIRKNNYNANFEITEFFNTDRGYDVYIEKAKESNESEMFLNIIFATDKEEFNVLGADQRDTLLLFAIIENKQAKLIRARRIDSAAGTYNNRKLYTKLYFDFSEQVFMPNRFSDEFLALINQLPVSSEQFQKIEERMANWNVYLQLLADKAQKNSALLKFKTYAGSDELSTYTFSFEKNLKKALADKKLGNAAVYLSFTKNESNLTDEEIIDSMVRVGEVVEINYQKNTILVKLNEEFHYSALRNKFSPTKKYIYLTNIGDVVLTNRLLYGMRQLKKGKAVNPNIEQLLFTDSPVVNLGENSYILDKSKLLNKNLNEFQLNAVKGALAAKDLYLIQGPPGTGKTTVIAEICYQNALRGLKTLVASQSNLAVDNALSRLIHDPKILTLRKGNVNSIEEEGLPFIEENVINTWVQNIISNSKAQIEIYNKIEEELNDDLAEILLAEEKLKQKREHLKQEIEELEVEIEKVQKEVEIKKNLLINKIDNQKEKSNLIKANEDNLKKIKDDINKNLSLKKELEEKWALEKHLFEQLKDNIINLENRKSILEKECSYYEKYVELNDELKKLTFELENLNNLEKTKKDRLIFLENKERYIDNCKAEAINNLNLGNIKNWFQQFDEYTNHLLMQSSKIENWIKELETEVNKKIELENVASVLETRVRKLKNKVKEEGLSHRLSDLSPELFNNVSLAYINSSGLEAIRHADNRPGFFKRLFGGYSELEAWKAHLVVYANKLIALQANLNNRIQKSKENIDRLLNEKEMVKILHICSQKVKVLIEKEKKGIENEIDDIIQKKRPIFTKRIDLITLKKSIEEQTNKRAKQFVTKTDIYEKFDAVETEIYKIKQKRNEMDFSLQILKKETSEKVNALEVANRQKEHQIRELESEIKSLQNELLSMSLDIKEIQESIENSTDLIRNFLVKRFELNDRLDMEKERENEVLATYKQQKEKIEEIIQCNRIKKELIEDWQREISSDSVDGIEQLKKIYIENANVIGITCVQSGSKKFSEMYPDFDVVIIDEVSKATPPEILLPMLKARKTILVGDHKQLPPMLGEETLKEVVEQGNYDNNKKIDIKNYLKESIFERLFKMMPSDCKEMLRIQYRMHPDIMGLIQQFYQEQGGLICGLANPDEDRNHKLTGNFVKTQYHAMWVDIPNEPKFFEKQSPITKSYYNEMEINVIKSIVEDIAYAVKLNKEKGLEAPFFKKEIGIISFYSEQIKLLEQEIDEMSNVKEHLSIRIGTVDRFQGIEKPIIIASLVRNNRSGKIGFARDFRRVNVAMSRAKELMIIVGSSKVFTNGKLDNETKQLYQNLFEQIKSIDSMFNLNGEKIR